MNHNINLNNTLNLITLLEKYNIYLQSNLIYDISYNLTNNTYINKHLSLLVDYKTKKIITYGFNYYLKSDKFPFSLHSEINTINKHYKKRLNKHIIKSKKILLIIKLSKIGIIGNSKPCQNCANFIYNNYDNLNLYKVMYSTQNNELEELNKLDLLYKEFKISAGFKQSFTLS
jgi:tRNA(Arg) A34 adenosine deaminase TadA